MMMSFHIPRVLLVEENPRIQQMVQSMLNLLAVQCVSANQADEAVRLFQQGCDLVLLDLHLNSVNGFELAQRMRASEVPGRHIPIIGHSTVATPLDVKPLCLQAGMDDLSPKLMCVESLFQVLKHWVAKPWVMPLYLADVHVPEHI